VSDHDLAWPEVAVRLAAARNYWMCTSMPSGAPHAAPVWGVVIGGTLYLYSERRTVKARNLAADPRVVVHLESGEDVVIVRGTAQDVGTPGQVPEVAAALSAKYTGEEDRQYLPDADPAFDVVYAIRPRSAMMWRLADYEGSQRRWISLAPPQNDPWAQLAEPQHLQDPRPERRFTYAERIRGSWSRTATGQLIGEGARPPPGISRLSCGAWVFRDGPRRRWSSSRTSRPTTRRPTAHQWLDQQVGTDPS
jgi:Pyridoxamine 5'-phosphate oxidase